MSRAAQAEDSFADLVQVGCILQRAAESADSGSVLGRGRGDRSDPFTQTGLRGAGSQYAENVRAGGDPPVAPGALRVQDPDPVGKPRRGECI